MPVAKGKIQPDNSYMYLCGNCNGAGRFLDSKSGQDADCTHCYNLDYAKLIEAFATARGQRYYALLKAILSLKGKAIVESITSRHNENGKIRVADLFHVMMEFNFPHNRFKPLVEWLEETRTIPTGMYERIRDSRLKVKDSLKNLGYEV